MARTLTSKINFQGFDYVSSTVGKITNSVRRLHGVTKKVGRSMLGTGGLLSVGATFPIATGIKKAAEGMMSFERINADLQATLRISTDEMTKMTKQSMALAKVYPQMADDIAKGQLRIAQAGYDDSSVVAIMESVTKFASVTKMSTDRAAAGLTNIVGAYHGTGLAADDLAVKTGRLADIMTYSATRFNQNPEQFMKGMEKFAPIARLAGLSIEEMAALQGTLADGSFQSAEGANSLRTIFLRLNAPTKKASLAFRDLGINLDDYRKSAKQAITTTSTLNALASGGLSNVGDFKGSGLAEILNDTTKPIEKRLDQVQDIIAKTRDMDVESTAKLRASLAQMINSRSGDLDEFRLLADLQKKGLTPAHVDAIAGKFRAAQFGALITGMTKANEELANLIQRSGGATDNYWKVISDTVQNQLDEAKSALDAFWKTVGQVNKGAISDGIVTFKNITNAASGWVESNSAIAKTVSLIGVALASVGPAMAQLGFMALGLSFALRPLTALVAIPLGLLATGLAGAASAAGLFATAIFRTGKAAAVARAALMTMSLAAAPFAALAATGYLIYKNWDKVKEAIGPELSWAVSDLGAAIGNLLKGDVSSALLKLEDAFGSLGHAVKNALTALEQNSPNFKGLMDSFRALGTAFTKLKDTIFGSVDAGEAGTQLKGSMEWFASAAANTASTVINALASGLDKLTNAIANFKKGSADGGILSGFKEAFAGMDSLTKLVAVLVGAKGGQMALGTAGGLVGAVAKLGKSLVKFGPFKLLVLAAAIDAMVGPMEALGGLNLLDIAGGLIAVVGAFKLLKGAVNLFKGGKAGVAKAADTAKKVAEKTKSVSTAVSSTAKNVTKPVATNGVVKSIGKSIVSGIKKIFSNPRNLLKGLGAGIALEAGKYGIDQAMPLTAEQKKFTSTSEILKRLFGGEVGKFPSNDNFKSPEFNAVDQLMKDFNNRQKTNSGNKLDTGQLGSLRDQNQATATAQAIKIEQDKTANAVNSSTGSIVGAIDRQTSTLSGVMANNGSVTNNYASTAPNSGVAVKNISSTGGVHP